MHYNGLNLYCDGGARGNPGPAGIGILITNKNGEILKKGKAFIGRKTNNQAEYWALIKGLELVYNYKVIKLKVFLDSELLVKQMKGEYKVKNKNLKPLFEKAKNLELKFKEISYYHIPREQNKITDKLVNEAIDEK